MNTTIDINKRTLSSWRRQLKKHRGAINDVAIKAGVEHPEVSMFLSGDRKMTEARMKIVTAIKDVLEEIKQRSEAITKQIEA